MMASLQVTLVKSECFVISRQKKKVFCNFVAARVRGYVFVVYLCVKVKTIYVNSLIPLKERINN